MDNSSKIPVNVNKLVELELNRQEIAKTLLNSLLHTLISKLKT